MNYLRLTDGRTKNEHGLINFRLGLWVDGKEVTSWVVHSGQAYAQNLKIFKNARTGSYEPIPQADYDLGMPDWAGGVGNYSASWGPGLGPVWIDIFSPGPGRSEFGFHLDSNRETAPGSAGCVVFSSYADLKVFIYEYLKAKPSKLEVDYGIKADKPKKVVKIVGHSGKLKMLLEGTWIDLDSLEIKGDWS